MEQALKSLSNGKNASGKSVKEVVSSVLEDNLKSLKVKEEAVIKAGENNKEIVNQKVKDAVKDTLKNLDKKGGSKEVIQTKDSKKVIEIENKAEEKPKESAKEKSNKEKLEFKAKVDQKQAKRK